VNEFQFAEPQWVHLLWTAPGVVLLVVYGNARRRRRLGVFGVDQQRAGEWLGAVRGRRLLRATVVAAALVFLTAAALQPRANPKRQQIETAARDLAICLDVSRSMLATDLSPSRLERAKLELSRLTDHLAGDRVGLIVYAGDAVIRCPLTSNYSYFKSVLRTVTPRATSQGGTNIGDAVRKAMTDLLGLEPTAAVVGGQDVRAGETIMEDEARGAKETFADILLITDGEDHGSYPQYAAEQAAALNVGMYTVGLGSAVGSTIPITDGDGGTKVLNYKGEPIISRLDSKLLTEMAVAGRRGAYLPVGTANFDLVDFYENKIVAQQPRREITEEHVYWSEVYQPVLFVGLALVVAAMLIPERPRQAQEPAAAQAV
jgi:Ca-activated chloride channel family protein